MNLKDKLITTVVVTTSAVLLTSLSASATPFGIPGATVGAVAAEPPPGIYFMNIMAYGGLGPSPTKLPGSTPFDVVYDTPILQWSTGYKILGADISLLAAPFVPMMWGNQMRDGKPGFPRPLRTGLDNPTGAIDFSWNLGGGFFAKIREQVYVPFKSQVTLAGSSDPGVVETGTAFQTSLTLSYISADWVVTGDVKYGIVTNDGIGVGQPNYLNTDLAVIRKIGKYELGVGAFTWNDVTKPANNHAVNAFGGSSYPGVSFIGGYNFGPLSMRLKWDQCIGGSGLVPGTTTGKNLSIISLTTVIPLWTPDAPTKVAAKY